MSIDGAFGSTGSIWTGVPSQRRSYFGAISGTVYLGGTTIGADQVADRAGAGGGGVAVGGGGSDARECCACAYAPDGHPAEVGRYGTGTLAQ